MRWCLLKVRHVAFNVLKAPPPDDNSLFECHKGGCVTTCAYNIPLLQGDVACGLFGFLNACVGFLSGYVCGMGAVKG